MLGVAVSDLVFAYLGRYNSGEFGIIPEDRSMRPAGINFFKNIKVKGIEREILGQVEEGPVTRLLLAT